MTKALLFDADGVTLQKHGYFSDKYAKEYGVPAEKITPFFKNEFALCQLGKADIKQILPKYLAQWGWEKTVDDFLDYWFKSNTVANDQVVAQVRKIRAQGTKCFVVTDQEKYRASYTRSILGFDKKFDGCFFSCELGHSKSEPEFFQAVINKLQLNPSEIAYFEDEQENVEVAKQAGIDAYFYNDFAGFLATLKELGISF